jgi:hypothetical protein
MQYAKAVNSKRGIRYDNTDESSIPFFRAENDIKYAD